MGQKFTMKVSNGSVWDDLYPKSTLDQILTDREIELQLTENFGAYKPGDILPVGTTVEDFIEKATQTRIPPTYTMPTLKLEDAGEYFHEVGESVPINILANFTRADAGPVEMTIRKDGTPKATSTVNDISWSEAVTIGEAPIEYVAWAAHSEGPMKNDNLGEPYPDGRIMADILISETQIHRGVRKVFYGADVNIVQENIMDSEYIRTFLSKYQHIATKNPIKLTVDAGSRMVLVALPPTITDVEIYHGSEDITNLFTYSTVDVAGKNDLFPIGYDVYVLQFAQPTPANMTFTVSLKEGEE